MNIEFSKTPFFLWSTFNRESNIKKGNGELFVQTNIKELKLIRNNKNFFFIKYFVVFVLMIFIVNFKEFSSLDISLLLAPILACVVYFYNKYWKEILIISIIPILCLFFYIDILYLPYFIKYLIISFVFLEFYFDIFKKEHFAVYELYEIQEDGEKLEAKNSKSIVSFASINKNQLIKEKN